MRIIFLGTPNYLDPIVKSLDENFSLVKVIRSTSAFQPGVGKLNLEGLQPDLFVVASFGRIIPQEVLDIPRLGAINIHPSKLPLYRGPSPIQAQILDGVIDSAISFMLIDEQMDHGPILYQEDYQIKPTDTLGSLLESMFSVSATILPTVIKSFVDKKLKPVDQVDSEATYCKEIKKEDGYFDIDNPPDPKTLDRMIRAYYPWPGTWTRWSPSAKASEDEQSSLAEKKGKIVKLLPEGKIQMEGKNITDLKSFLNGYPDFPQIL